MKVLYHANGCEDESCLIGCSIVQRSKKEGHMPMQVLPTVEGFHWLKEKLESWGFQMIPGFVFRRKFHELKLEAPRPRKSRETGFTFSANGLEVYVWTTWLAREEEARESDAGWIVITQNGQSLYYSHPINRTEDFLKRLGRFAWIGKRRVTHRPQCRICGTFMDITEGHYLKQRYWRCNSPAWHPSAKSRRLEWDAPLPPKARELMKTIRAKRAKDKRRAKRKAKEEGRQPPRPAILIRKPWKNGVATRAT